MLILEIVAAEVREHKDKRSRFKMTFSIQHRVLVYLDRTGLSEMVKKIHIGSAKAWLSTRMTPTTTTVGLTL